MGVGFEADDHGRTTLPARLFDQPPEDEPVTQMDAVEVADGHDRALHAGGDFFTAADHVHNNRLTSSMGSIP